jgi:hypothetical protein
VHVFSLHQLLILPGDGLLVHVAPWGVLLAVAQGLAQRRLAVGSQALWEALA